MKTGNKLPLAMWFFGWCSFMVFCAGMGVLPAIAQTTAEGFVRLGMKHYAKGQLQEALVSFDEVIAVKPDYALAYTNRGLVKYRLGELDGSLADHTRVIEIDPRLAEAYTNRGGQS